MQAGKLMSYFGIAECGFGWGESDGHIAGTNRRWRDHLTSEATRQRPFQHGFNTDKPYQNEASNYAFR